MESNQNPEISLKRCFGLRETITLTVGTVIGVGLFTVGANVVGLLGPWVLMATVAALAISIYPALLYAEMGAMLPFAGGTYQYASLGLNRPMGMLAGWNFIISMVAVASGEAMAFSYYLKTLFDALGLPLALDDRWIACGAVLLFLILGMRGVKITGRLQNGFLFFFWGVAIVWFFSMLPSFQTGGFQQAGGWDLSGFLPCVAMVWWCFAGFETCCAMGEEIRYPQINLPRALKLAPFLVFAVNGLFQWVLVSTVPRGQLGVLAQAAAPYAEGMRLAGVVGFPLVLLCLGITLGGDFSTLNASITAPARYLYTMARDGALPRAFARLHAKYRTPWLSILVLGILMLLLVGTDSVQYIASLSLFATLLYYVIGMLAACGLRKKEPLKTRPYRAPFLRVGAPVSIAIYLLMMTQLQWDAVLAGLLWCAVGLALYGLYGRRHLPEKPPCQAELPQAPPPAEKQRMDREFRIWRGLVIAAVTLVVLLYLLAFVG